MDVKIKSINQSITQSLNIYPPKRQLFTPSRLELHEVVIIPTINHQDSTNTRFRQPVRLHDIEPLEEKTKAWSGTSVFTIRASAFCFPFTLLAPLTLHVPMRLIPTHILYWYKFALLKLLRPYPESVHPTGRSTLL